MHDAFTIGIPTLVILLGILLNRRDLLDFKADIKADLNRRFDEVDRKFDGVHRRLDRIDDDLKDFHHVTGNLEGRIDEVSRR